MNYYIVDAFTSEKFKGNPAGVCILEKIISDDIMQKIAYENNLPETAFAYKEGDNYKLRWFTPTFEIDLCGHGTLATAYVIFTYVEPDINKIQFETLSGILEVTRNKNLFEMLLPLRVPKNIEVTTEIIEALGFVPEEIYSDRDLYVVMKSEEEIKAFTPNYDKLQSLNQWLGIVITSEGRNSDFVSRYFCPEIKCEDPVTGSSHSSLVPLWSEKKKKNKFFAKQVSPRGGVLYCEMKENYVKVSGEATLYMQGEIMV